MSISLLLRFSWTIKKTFLMTKLIGVYQKSESLNFNSQTNPKAVFSAKSSKLWEKTPRMTHRNQNLSPPAEFSPKTLSSQDFNKNQLLMNRGKININNRLENSKKFQLLRRLRRMPGETCWKKIRRKELGRNHRKMRGWARKLKAMEILWRR